MFINFYSLLILEMGMFKKILCLNWCLYMMYRDVSNGQSVQCLKYLGLNLLTLTFVFMFGLILSPLIIVQLAVNLCTRINTGTYTSMMSACNLIGQRCLALQKFATEFFQDMNLKISFEP